MVYLHKSFWVNEFHSICMEFEFESVEATGCNDDYSMEENIWWI